MTKDELKLDVGIYIACHTKQEYINVLTILKEEGLEWNSGGLPLKHIDYWYSYTSILCLKYSHKIAFVRNSIPIAAKIISAEDFIKLKTAFVLPEKWAIKVVAGGEKTNPEVYKWRNSFFNIEGYITYDKIWYRELPITYTEITLEQFKKYVLKEQEINKSEQMETSNMYTIEGSIALKEAFIKEVGFKTLSDETHSKYNYLAAFDKGKKIFSGENAKRNIHFILPQDWDNAVKYVKELYEEPSISLPKIGGYKGEISTDKSLLKYGCKLFDKVEINTLIAAMNILGKVNETTLSLTKRGIGDLFGNDLSKETLIKIKEVLK